MAGMLKVIAIGNLGSDPEMRSTKGGKDVCNFRIACNVGRGEEEKTEWIGAVCFGKTAELAVKYLKKGSPVYVDGRLQTREWTTKDGAPRKDVEVVVDNLVFIGGRAGGPAEATPAAARVTADDIPF